MCVCVWGGGGCLERVRDDKISGIFFLISTHIIPKSKCIDKLYKHKFVFQDGNGIWIFSKYYSCVLS